MSAKRFVIAFCCVILSALLGGGLALMVRPFPTQQEASGGVASAIFGAKDPFGIFPQLDKPMNILLMGSDIGYGRKGTPIATLDGNTDTMILVHVDPAASKVLALSIPRDTRVDIEGHGTFKINAANPFGGAKLAVKTVSRYLDVPIDRYVRVNTLGVIQAIDALGGVKIFVERRMKYQDDTAHLYINFNRGWYTLNGKQAHAYIRFRHDELGDIGRVQRQQAFIRAAMEQALQPATLLKVPQLLQILNTNMDTDLSTMEILKLVRFGKDFKRDQLQMVMLPGTDDMIGGLSYWIGYPERLSRTLAKFRPAPAHPDGDAVDPSGEPSATPSLNPGDFAITVRDGTGRGAGVREMIRALKEAGYRASEGYPSNGDPLIETEVIAQTGDTDAAQAITDLLGGGKVIAASTGDVLSDLTVVVGEDWVKRLETLKVEQGTTTLRVDPGLKAR